MLASYPSRSTTQLWHSTANPMLYLLPCFVMTIIALVAAFTFGFLEGAGYGSPSGGVLLGLMAPWPIVALIWTTVDAVMCRHKALHPKQAIVSGSVIVFGYVVFGAICIGAWYGGNVDWVIAAWELLCAIPYAVYLWAAVRALKAGKKASKAEARVRGLQSET
nr:hypothetical protein B0A51_10511 [Rachicladosporium sp. CCFEE 5018]